MSLCACAFGPRCESAMNCVDEGAAVGVKDRRTGEIRKHADWSIMMPTFRGLATNLKSRQVTGTYELLRPLFYCDACLEELREAQSKPLVGIDRPAHASDFWRPSIIHHVKMTALENHRQERARQAPTDYESAVTQFVTAQIRSRATRIPRVYR